MKTRIRIISALLILFLCTVIYIPVNAVHTTDNVIPDGFEEFAQGTFTSRENITLEFGEYSELGELLLETLERFFSVIATGDITVFPEGLQDLDTYILLKYIQFNAKYFEVFNNGAYSPIITTLVIEDVSYADNITIADIYAGYNFIFDQFNTAMCNNIGSYYRVIIDDGRVLSIKSGVNPEIDQHYTKLAQIESEYQAANNKSFTLEQKIAALDDIFDEMNQEVYILKDMIDREGLFPNAK